eukprot:353578-Chlamydomonas_euryale.AAC.3
MHARQCPSACVTLAIPGAFNSNCFATNSQSLQRAPLSRTRYNSAALLGCLSLRNSEPAQSRNPGNPIKLHGHVHASPMG